MLPECGTRDELMGIEGAAAREYFAALGQIMPEDLRFRPAGPGGRPAT